RSRHSKTGVIRELSVSWLGFLWWNLSTQATSPSTARRLWRFREFRDAGTAHFHRDAHRSR
ncbi:hypothetical protein U9M48_016046, partial [Paspalum notatum var. saurae]